MLLLALSCCDSRPCAAVSAVVASLLLTASLLLLSSMSLTGVPVISGILAVTGAPAVACKPAVTSRPAVLASLLFPAYRQLLASVLLLHPCYGYLSVVAGVSNLLQLVDCIPAKLVPLLFLHPCTVKKR
jgi:hypothetical protein